MPGGAHCASQATPEPSVSPQFLALDDLSDSCANVDLRGDQVLSVSAPSCV